MRALDVNLTHGQNFSPIKIKKAADLIWQPSDFALNFC